MRNHPRVVPGLLALGLLLVLVGFSVIGSGNPRLEEQRGPAAVQAITDTPGG
jgi:hypothetical protein